MVLYLYGIYNQTRFLNENLMGNDYVQCVHNYNTFTLNLFQEIFAPDADIESWEWYQICYDYHTELPPPPVENNEENEGSNGGGFLEGGAFTIPLFLIISVIIWAVI